MQTEKAYEAVALAKPSLHLRVALNHARVRDSCGKQVVFEQHEQLQMFSHNLPQGPVLFHYFCSSNFDTIGKQFIFIKLGDSLMLAPNVQVALPNLEQSISISGTFRGPHAA